MDRKVVVGKYSYTLPDSVTVRGSEYEMLHVYSQHLSVTKKKMAALKKKTGNIFGIKMIPNNETLRGFPPLYVVYGKAR
jgi:hypothetical protein